MTDTKFFQQLGIEEGKDLVLAEIRRDMQGISSPLALMDAYLDEARGTAANDPPVYAKLAKLFEKGIAPKEMKGHCFGITMGLRTGNRKGFLQQYGNALNFFWGKLLADAPPWVGKGFAPFEEEAKQKLLGGKAGDAPCFLGMNYFLKDETSILNKISIAFLDLNFKLRKTAGEERNRYGYDKTGGSFVGRLAKSVNSAMRGKEVFQINYRFPYLNNSLPLKWLIDEIVEVAPGLYLGQLLFATKRLFTPYDPESPDADYGYQHFGYFLIMDERWNDERRKLFPYTENIWRTKASAIDWIKEPKYSRFTFADKPDGAVDDALLKEVMADKEDKKTVLDLLKMYSDQIAEDKDITSCCFAKLGEIFNRAVPPRDVQGYFHGAVVAFRNEGFWKTFNVNTLNMLWPAARQLSPWTGKTFEDISAEQVDDLTNGFEQIDRPFRWGTNTYAERTAVQKMAVEAMRLLNIRLDKASKKETLLGYDCKGFFFIGKQAKSVNPDNGGKTVYQFNYRWPKLEVFPPDNFCTDELVQIAEGLYMGQLLYATKLLLEPYDPRRSVADYCYKNFGYFLLMNDEWYARKIEIGFDVPH
jgi:hypothetical protein